MGQPRIDITPEAVDRAAQNFAIGQQDLISAYQNLAGRLQAASSMAGDDKAAHQFATLYTPAGQAAYQAFHAAIEALGGTSLGLTQTINNHLAADHHSRADDPAGPPPRYPPHQVSTSFAVDASPPAVTGFNWAPSTTVPRLRVKVPHLPGWVTSIIGDSPDWPQGNDHLLDEAGNAWQAAAQEVDKVASWLNWTISTILDPGDNAEHTAISNYWATLYKPGDSTTVLSGLSTMCQTLANACHDYAAATRKAADIVAVETIVEIIALLGAEVAARLIGRVLRPILARVGAYMMRAVAGIAERYAIRAVLADLTSAVANTKVVKAVQAAFEKTAGKALGKDVAAAERRLGLVPGTPEYEKRLAELAEDPAHGGVISAKSRREAEVGLQLERDGLLPGPIKRAPFDDAGNDQGEFLDANGTFWDVKSSPDLQPPWGRDPGNPIPRPQPPQRFASMISKELDAGQNVVLDPIGMSPERLNQLKQLVADHPEWRGRVIWAA
ncbi:WXG100-like domain-containing protein [Actinoallomurus rhizosphaericola]|uniref:WXG100-like domain-containing protein n=1 Tax=Actinoallomurus rhizosphaericola TaxID=2952536 RepID=UPI0020902536|nr:hypothetical protein [Actinoallomurus rhizosphaericola]MCO5994759.1 hypothetical protein [Actinoallomurus rhizosphaericola]